MTTCVDLTPAGGVAVKAPSLINLVATSVEMAIQTSRWARSRELSIVLDTAYPLSLNSSGDL